MKAETERKIVKIIIITIFVVPLLLILLIGINDLKSEINYNKDNGAITEGKIIEIKYEGNGFSKKNYIRRVIIVQYTVNNKDYTLTHRNESWDEKKWDRDKIGDIKKVRYNIYNPNKADLVPTLRCYIEYILMISVLTISIAIYIIAMVFIVREGKYA